MEKNICPICGSPYSERDGHLFCRYCGYIKPETVTEEEAALLYEASAKLRLADFDGARERYEDIVSRFPRCAEAYWGLCLARYGIKYEDDYDGKKVATCYAASYEDIYGNKDYQKALQFAAPELKAYYESQAKIIEKRREEWVNKASKEPPYDVFLSYKDTDDGQRTADSSLASDLYGLLTRKGYRVFFSRVTLAGKVGENYEPYIFAALNSAPVMLVVACSSDHVKATWVKNEWNRYLARIKAGEKDPSSLCVVIDGFDPYELPSVLKAKQHLVYTDQKGKPNLTFSSDLLAYVEKQVSAASLKTRRFERKEVALSKKQSRKGIEAAKTEEVTSIKKKNKAIVSPLERRSIGGGTIPILSASQESKLALAEAYLSRGEYEQSLAYYEDVLNENQRSPEANLGKMLCLSKKKSLADWSASPSLTDLYQQMSLALLVVDYGGGETGKTILDTYAFATLDALKKLQYSTALAFFKAIAGYEGMGSYAEKVMSQLEKGEIRGETLEFIRLCLPYVSTDPSSYQKHLFSLTEACLQIGFYEPAQEFIGQYAEFFDFDVDSYVLFLCASHSCPNESTLFEKLGEENDFSCLSSSLPLEHKQIEELFGRLSNYALGQLSTGQDISSYVAFLLPYPMPFRDNFLAEIRRYCFAIPNLRTSDILLAILPVYGEKQRDEYNAVLKGFAKACLDKQDYRLAKTWLDKAIDYAPEDKELYSMRIEAALKGTSSNIQNLADFSDIEAILSLRGKDEKCFRCLKPYLEACLASQDPTLTSETFHNLLMYLPKEEEDVLSDLLLQMGDRLLSVGQFDKASRFYGELASLDPKAHKAHWGMLKCRLSCKRDADVANSQTPIADLPEYKNAVLGATGDKAALSFYIDIELQQRKNIAEAIQTEEKRIAKQKIRTRRRKIFAIAGSSASLVAITSLVLVFTVIAPAVKEKRISTGRIQIESGDYAQAMKALGTLNTPEAKELYGMARGGECFSLGDYETGIQEITDAGGEVHVHYDGGEYTLPKTQETLKKQSWIANSPSGYALTWQVDHFSVTVSSKPYNAELYLKALRGEKINYSISYVLNGGTNATSNPSSYTVEDSVELADPSKTGHTFLGWLDPNGNQVASISAGTTGDLTLTALWNAGNDYTVTLNPNGGVLSQTSIKVKYDNTYSLPNPTRSGYKFDGWFDGSAKVNSQGNWTCPENKTFIAHWTASGYTITYKLNGGTNATSNPSSYTVEDSVELADPTLKYKTFDGWFDQKGIRVVTINKGTTGDLVLEARWSQTESQKEEEEEWLIAHGIVPSISQDGKKVTYGLYPKTVVSDPSLITSLNSGLASQESNGWFLFEGDYYVSNYAKPLYSGYTFSNGISITSGKSYWFKCEPIEWKVLSSSDGDYFLASEYLLDTRSFNEYYVDLKNGHYANNYKESAIRQWLNGDFLESAFSLGGSSIKTTLVDNSASSTGFSTNPYVCENTNDKVFLLSCEEITSSAFGFSSDSNRTCKVTDYAVAMGAAYSSNSTYFRNGDYYTRSPSDTCSYWTWYVSNTGKALECGVDISNFGVRPALHIEKQATTGKNVPALSEDGKKVTYGLYPKTVVSDSSLISSLNGLSAPESNGWYLFGEEYYASLSAAPYDSSYTFSNGASITSGKSYWFKCEPIEWKVLSSSDGDYFLASEYLLDARRFNENYAELRNGHYANNYKESEIRQWLNGDFLESAFSLGGSSIKTTLVDNSASSTGFSTNPYACENTEDKVFLLSYDEVTSSSWGLSSGEKRSCQVTDYAIAKGVYYSDDSSYSRKGKIYTRSPSTSSSANAVTISYTGTLINHTVASSFYGVRPALRIHIDS